jgi:hypothetical protein
MQYVIAPSKADIIHYGKGHDDNPPGRGSGRYGWGTTKSGKKKSSRAQEEAKRKALANKEDIIKKGSPSEVSLLKGELSREERREILDRLDFEAKLNSYTQSELDAGWNAIDNSMKKVAKVNSWANIGLDIVKTISGLVYETNSFGQHSKSGGGQSQGDGKKKK